MIVLDRVGLHVQQDIMPTMDNVFLIPASAVLDRMSQSVPLLSLTVNVRHALRDKRINQ